MGKLNESKNKTRLLYFADEAGKADRWMPRDSLASVALSRAPSFPLTRSLWLSEVEDKRCGSWGCTKKVKVKNLYSKFGRPTLMRSTKGNKLVDYLVKQHRMGFSPFMALKIKAQPYCISHGCQGECAVKLGMTESLGKLFLGML